MRDFDTLNPPVKFDPHWTNILVCPYCGVDYTKVFQGKTYLLQHIRKYHTHTKGKQMKLE